MFNVVPTVLEVSMVACILAYRCGPAFAGLTAFTIAAYTLFTFSVTQVWSRCSRSTQSVACVRMHVLAELRWRRRSGGPSFG